MLLLSVVLACAQYISVEVRREPLSSKPPQAAPEPRVKRALSPDALFAMFASNDEVQHNAAIDHIGIGWPMTHNPVDVRLFAVNIDTDDDLERVLISRGHGDAVAIVAKKEAGEWWELGGFLCCGPSGGALDIELKETVWFGTKDIVVHSGGAQGTGIGAHSLRIYRVLGGHMYKVLDVVEEAYNWAESQSARVRYPDLDSHEPAVILVETTKQAGARRTTTCTRHSWDAARFAFVASRPTPGACPARL